MQTLLGTVGLAWVLLVSATPAQAAPITIGFDDPALTLGTEVGDFYAALGVTFVDGTIAVSSSHYYYQAGTRDASNVLVHSTTGSQPQPDNPIEVIFDSAVSFVSLEGLGIGISGYMLSAYDAAVSGNLLATAQMFGSGQPGGNGAFNLFTPSLSASGIRRLEISQIISTYDGAMFDNLTFERQSVPEPGTLALLGAGLLGNFLVMRRRR